VRGRVYNLHAVNPHRGVTWFDPATNVVFLLGVTEEHDYRVFEIRSANDELMPTRVDYEDLRQHQTALTTLDSDAFLEHAERDGHELLERALASPGALIQGRLGGELPTYVQIEVVVIDGSAEHGDVYAAVRFADRIGQVQLQVQLTVELHSDLADVLFPEANPEHITLGEKYFPYPRGFQRGDFVIRWRRT